MEGKHEVNLGCSFLPAAKRSQRKKPALGLAFIDQKPIEPVLVWEIR